MLDSAGHEIKIGDKVSHILGSIPWEPMKGEDPDAYSRRYAAHPKTSDGFDGIRTVEGFASSTCVLIGGGLDRNRSCVFLGSFLRVEPHDA